MIQIPPQIYVGTVHYNYDEEYAWNVFPFAESITAHGGEYGDSRDIIDPYLEQCGPNPIGRIYANRPVHGVRHVVSGEPQMRSHIILDPRGFSYGVNVENLSALLQHSIIEFGEFVTPCIWVKRIHPDGGDYENYLMSTLDPEYLAAIA
jgi:hypothetical protein